MNKEHLKNEYDRNTFSGKDRHYNMKKIPARELISRYKRADRSRAYCFTEGLCFFLLKDDINTDELFDKIYKLNINYGFLELMTGEEKKRKRILYFINNNYVAGLFTDICRTLTDGKRIGGLFVILPIFEEGYSFNTNNRCVIFDHEGNETEKRDDIVLDDVKMFLSKEAGKESELGTFAEEYISSVRVGGGPLFMYAKHQEEVGKKLAAL